MRTKTPATAATDSRIFDPSTSRRRPRVVAGRDIAARQIPSSIAPGNKWNTKLKHDCTNMPASAASPPSRQTSLESLSPEVSEKRIRTTAATTSAPNKPINNPAPMNP